MIVLGVETSCDETSAAVLHDGQILSSIISSQDVHEAFGGVVPELASREHVRLIVPMVRQALQKAELESSAIEACAVTYGPGLVGALLVGLNFIKGFSAGRNIPYIGVNHIEGHIYGTFLSNPDFAFPVLFLIVSGGHTQLVLMPSHLQYEIVGETIDDAVGEAFDKGAKMLGLGYPGGPVIDRLAADGNPEFFEFPRALRRHDNLNFSYSGLKTSLLTFINKNPQTFIQENLSDICASYQAAAVDILIEKALTAARSFGCPTIGLAGGVAANSRLRAKLQQKCAANGSQLLIPELKYCTDNAAMIARAGYEYLKSGHFSAGNLNAWPALRLGLNRSFESIPV